MWRGRSRRLLQLPLLPSSAIPSREPTTKNRLYKHRLHIPGKRQVICLWWEMLLLPTGTRKGRGSSRVHSSLIFRQYAAKKASKENVAPAVFGASGSSLNINKEYTDKLKSVIGLVPTSSTASASASTSNDAMPVGSGTVAVSSAESESSKKSECS